jgi:hypothetical protein
MVHITQGTVTTDTTALTTPTIQALADDDLLVVVSCPDPSLSASGETATW